MFHGIGPIHLVLDAGECVGITGASGTGKSLFLRTIADLEPFAGTVALDGVVLTDMPAHLWRTQVGLLPAESAWWLPTAGNHLKAVAAEWLADLGFSEEVLTWSVSRLSSGERQRLSLLRLLGNRPRVLLLDEPTANLDSENAFRVEALIRKYRLANEAAVLWVSHDPRQIERVATRHLVMRDHGLARTETS
ncbi:MAG TPA: ATP-binding cassette domain-containing protein [Desulfosarcina sp.]|nr:ATP-binding cassette domain-containing protein [Desulfosarcina sp.]